MENSVDLEGKTQREDICYRDSTEIEAHVETLAMEEPQYPQSKSTQWTDEKHSLYLKLMEASFVNWLYGSLDLCGRHTQNKCSSNPKSSKQKHTTPSGQYKVFQHGCWTKIDFRKDKPQLKKANESSILLASPWINHYRSPCRHQMEENSDLQEMTTIDVEHNQYSASKLSLCHQGDVASISEVMDQNFVDEDPEGGNSSIKPITKRTKFH